LSMIGDGRKRLISRTAGAGNDPLAKIANRELQRLWPASRKRKQAFSRLFS
jgi:hypothetical protein